jgi:predicted MFS family arabinose efflux permease
MAQGIGIAWLVLQLTGSAIDLGLVSVALFGPVLVAGAWAGAFLDRVDCRRTLMATQAATAALALVLAVLTVTGAVEVWMVFALTVGAGFVFAVDQPARQLYVVELVGRERVQSAVGLYEVTLNASRVLGPAVGGLLIATLGVSSCFFANAASCLPALLVLVWFRPAARAARPPAQRSLAAIREGLAYVRRSPAIVACLVIAGAAGMVFPSASLCPCSPRASSGW